MNPTARAIAFLSPLTYAQDLMKFAILGAGLLNPWADLGVLLLTGVLFLLPSIKLHQRSWVLGYYKICVELSQDENINNYQCDPYDFGAALAADNASDHLRLHPIDYHRFAIHSFSKVHALGLLVPDSCPMKIPDVALW
jgi:hypothetical protein